MISLSVLASVRSFGVEVRRLHWTLEHAASDSDDQSTVNVQVLSALIKISVLALEAANVLLMLSDVSRASRLDTIWKFQIGL